MVSGRARSVSTAAVSFLVMIFALSSNGPTFDWSGPAQRAPLPLRTIRRPRGDAMGILSARISKRRTEMLGRLNSRRLDGAHEPREARLLGGPDGDRASAGLRFVEARGGANGLVSSVISPFSLTSWEGGSRAGRCDRPVADETDRGLIG